VKAPPWIYLPAVACQGDVVANLWIFLTI